MSQLLRRFHAQSDRIEDEKKIAKAVLDGELGVVPRGVHAPRSAEGDAMRLRGVPCIARSVAGAIPGTNPLAALLASERIR